jgi:TolA-binding protein
VKSLLHFGPVAAMAAILLIPASAVAQRQAPTPDQRLERLERQVDQMQRQVFPRGRPADTAGISTEPAATQSSVATLDQRIDSLERQMADMLRQSEENGHRLQSMEADLAKLRTDQEQRIAALEQRLTEAASTQPVVAPPLNTEPGPKPSSTKPPKTSLVTPPASTTVAIGGPVGDPGEDAYTLGFKQWEAGNFDAAITTLKGFTAAYPKHRRVSYANNLIGRSLMSKGDTRGAAAIFLANYRNNPGGERAGDSLYYLGQAAMQLGQPGQACKVYSEFDAIYGAKARAELKKQVADAKTQAQC